MGDSDKKDEWLKRVLGVSLNVHTPPEHQKKQVRFAPLPENTMKPQGQGVQLRMRPGRSQPVVSTPPPQLSEFKSDNRRVQVMKTSDGRVTYTAPSPPVGEITFSGGGGKGAALPGAVKALFDTGVLKDAKKIAGASVGSMTAALVAAGITGDEFAEIANAPETTERIVEGSGGTKLGLLGAAIKNKFKNGSGNPLTGDGLEDVVCDALNLTLARRIDELKEACKKKNEPLPPAVDQVLKSMAKSKQGPTFMDLRVLSKFIPGVKEAVITGTYTTEKDGDDKQMKDGNKEGLLYVFSADTEPDLPVARAVHASASFPKAFKPVHIKLSSGLTVRFVDGGVMNNTPTTTSLGNERDLDGMPQERGMTFVFEDDGKEKKNEKVSTNLLKGTVNPTQGKTARLVDWVVGASHVGSEYAKNRDMTDRPEDIVVVPLKLSRPKTSKQGTKKIDMRGGTLEFNLSDQDKQVLQTATETATREQIERENKRDRSREFSSESQMFVSIPLKDLALLAQGGYAGAAQALAFRQNVAERIQELTLALTKARSEDSTDTLLDHPAVKQALASLDQMAGNDLDFQGYVGRELNRGALDTLVDKVRKGKKTGGVLDATLAVADTLAVRSGADHILKNVLYPQMKMQGHQNGAGMQTIQVMEALLREARTKDEVNQALNIGIDHFKNKSDRGIFKYGHKAFAQRLQHQLMR